MNWADLALYTSDWKTVTLPANWGQLGATTGGVFWLRKDVTLSATPSGIPSVAESVALRTAAGRAPTPVDQSTNGHP